MVYIVGTAIDTSKFLVNSLKKIRGINLTRAKLICQKVGISPLVRSSELVDRDWRRIRGFIQQNEFLVGKDLQQRTFKNISKLVDCKFYKGMRHKYGLSVRGQQTRSNSKTQKRIGVQRLALNRFFSGGIGNVIEAAFSVGQHGVSRPVVLDSHQKLRRRRFNRALMLPIRRRLRQFRKMGEEQRHVIPRGELVREIPQKTKYVRKVQLKKKKKLRKIVYPRPKPFYLLPFKTFLKPEKGRQYIKKWRTLAAGISWNYWKAYVKAKRELRLSKQWLKDFLLVRKRWVSKEEQLQRKRLLARQTFLSTWYQVKTKCLHYRKYIRHQKQYKAARSKRRLFSKKWKNRVSSYRFSWIARQHRVQFNKTGRKRFFPFQQNKLIPKMSFGKRLKLRTKTARKYVTRANYCTVVVKTKYTNVLAYVYDKKAKLLFWISGGMFGKGRWRGSFVICNQVCLTLLRTLRRRKIKELNLRMDGAGYKRRIVLRFLMRRFKIGYIEDRTLLPHNGCRRQRAKR